MAELAFGITGASVVTGGPGLASPSKHLGQDHTILTRRIGEDLGTEQFSLPWQEDDAWVSEFLECSRILARGRYSDEAAQLLIHRVSLFLESRGKSLRDVHVLAGITAPALLLASAMHRWWPIEEGVDRPSIADLGYYMLLHPDATPPVIAEKKGVLIVQDVLSAGVMSGRLITRLQKHGTKLLGLISLIQLTDVQQTQATRALDWHERYGVPHHAMIRMRRPPQCASPSVEDPDSRHFWIEPRTLRPFQYSMLRGDRPSAPALSTPSVLGANSFEIDDGCLLRAGHYTYGNRHHSLAIDVQRGLQGELGDRLACWIADICEDAKNRVKPAWESDGGHRMGGDVSAVLMPLNSQIHDLFFEEYLRCIGFPQPDEDSCPQCLDLNTIRALKEQRSRISGDDEVFRWLTLREKQLIPIAVEDKHFQQLNSIKLRNMIEILPPRRSTADGTEVYYRASYADTAIGMFHELMYRSYPPDDVFRQMARTFSAESEDEVELNRYRWAVLEWGIRNWPRVVASGGRKSFFQCARLELKHNTTLLAPLFQALACLHHDERYDDEIDDGIIPDTVGGRISLLRTFITEAIDTMVFLDNSRDATSAEQPPDRAERLINLDTALNLFFMQLKEEQVQSAESETAHGLECRLVRYLEQSVKKVEEHTLGFVCQLFMRLRRPQHSIGPEWPLYVIAESLFRSGESEGVTAADHILLRGWLRKVRNYPGNREYRTLLQGSLGQFLTALEDLTAYTGPEILMQQGGFVKHATKVMDWLGANAQATNIASLTRFGGAKMILVPPRAFRQHSTHYFTHP